jgi:hypothetical protein
MEAPRFAFDPPVKYGSKAACISLMQRSVAREKHCAVFQSVSTAALVLSKLDFGTQFCIAALDFAADG